jgi:NAD(P)-dependent dehydrogenase (short-subunit alcohol dehydrogenase family)
MKAILTGHTRGIGKAVAVELLSRNIPVLALARCESQELAARFPGLLQQVCLDLADSAALSDWLNGDLLDCFLKEAQSLLLVNNAGCVGPMAPLGRQEHAALIQAVSLNVTAPLLVSDALARRYPGELRIAHVSSGAGRSAYAGWSVYGATKAALDHHARCVQKDNDPRLRISSIAPGIVDTDMQAAIRLTDERDFPLHDQFVTLKEQGRLSSPEAVAGKLVGYLLSEDFGNAPVSDVRDL